MSGLISSFISRRLSAGTAAGPVPAPAPSDALSHANQDPSAATPPRDNNTDADAEAPAARDAPRVPSARSVPLLERVRRYSSFTRQPNDVVVAEEPADGDASINTTTAPIEIPGDATNMSSNPSRALEHRFRSADLDPPVSSAPVAPTAPHGALASTLGQHAGGMSESLPADDGFAHLRARIHE